MTHTNALECPIIVFVNGDFSKLENGSQVRINDLVLYLSHHCSKLIVYSYYEHYDYPWDEAARNRFSSKYPNVSLLLDHVSIVSEMLRRLKGVALAIAPSIGKRMLKWKVRGLSPAYDKICKSNSNAILFVNFVDGLARLNGIIPHTIVETHDIKFVKFSKLSQKFSYDLRVVGKLRSEVASLTTASALVAISPTDSTVFRSLIPDIDIYYIPAYPIGEAINDNIKVYDDHNYSFDLLFVGADNEFNVDGICKFIKTNLSWLKGYKLAIAGRVSLNPKVISAANMLENCKLLGFVEDLSELYLLSKSVISPVDGTGLKIKVVEALKYGKPVFASQHSRDALPSGYEKCVFPISQENIINIIANEDDLNKARSNALIYAKSLSVFGDSNLLISKINKLSNP